MDIVLCTREEAENSLSHHGVKGQKHGVRRWQNKNGSYTSEGYKHYAEMYGWGKKKDPTQLDKEAKENIKNAGEVAKITVATAAPVVGTMMVTKAMQTAQLAAANAHHIKVAHAQLMGNIEEILWHGSKANEFEKLAQLFGDTTTMVGALGGLVVAGLAIGTVSFAAASAYKKVRSALEKRKINKRIVDDALKNAVKHSDDDEDVSAADILDSMSDEQKLAVVMVIDTMLKAK